MITIFTVILNDEVNPHWNIGKIIFLWNMIILKLKCYGMTNTRLRILIWIEYKWKRYLLELDSIFLKIDRFNHWFLLTVRSCFFEHPYFEQTFSTSVDCCYSSPPVVDKNGSQKIISGIMVCNCKSVLRMAMDGLSKILRYLQLLERKKDLCALENNTDKYRKCELECLVREHCEEITKY